MNTKFKNDHPAERIIEAFLRIIERDFSELGGGWPATASQIKGYFSDIFYTNLYRKYQQNPERFQKAIFQLPITILRNFLLRDSILALKIAKKYHHFKITNEEIIHFFLTIVAVLADKTHNDPFSLKRELLILDKGELSEMTVEHWLKVVDFREKREINNLSVTLQSYLWSVQFDVYAYGIYWHGPYPLEDGTILLIKEFFDLNLPFWDEIDYSSARIYYLFSQGNDMGIDATCNLNYKDDIWDNLTKVKVLVDGKNISSMEEIKKLDRYFSTARKKQVKQAEKLSSLGVIKKGIEIYHYMFREFFNFYNEDWKPGKEIEIRVEKLGLYYWNKFKNSGQTMSHNQLRHFLVELYDPRNDFTG